MPRLKQRYGGSRRAFGSSKLRTLRGFILCLMTARATEHVVMQINPMMRHVQEKPTTGTRDSKRIEYRTPPKLEPAVEIPTAIALLVVKYCGKRAREGMTKQPAPK